MKTFLWVLLIAAVAAAIVLVGRRMPPEGPLQDRLASAVQSVLKQDKQDKQDGASRQVDAGGEPEAGEPDGAREAGAPGSALPARDPALPPRDPARADRGGAASERPVPDESPPQTAAQADKPGGRPLRAPEGVYYLTERHTVFSDSGVTGFDPGTQVRLVEDRGDTMLVRINARRVEIPADQLTNDLRVLDEITRRQQAGEAP